MPEYLDEFLIAHDHADPITYGRPGCHGCELRLKRTSGELCGFPSSVSSATCILPPGHPCDSPFRFHRFDPVKDRRERTPPQIASAVAAFWHEQDASWAEAFLLVEVPKGYLGPRLEPRWPNRWRAWIESFDRNEFGHPVSTLDYFAPTGPDALAGLAAMVRGEAPSARSHGATGD